MTILPGLTSTKEDRIPKFLADLRESRVRIIAFFPTMLKRTEREVVYPELERIDGLTIPHVHLRSDFDEAECKYLVERFRTEAFNIHPRLSTHPFVEAPRKYSSIVFVENVMVPPEDKEVSEFGGICPDYAHLESARHLGLDEYVERVERQLVEYPIGCCHISAIRVGEPNSYNGAWDHHFFKSLADFDYLARYRDVLPARWLSLELENTLSEQLEAIAHLEQLLRTGSQISGRRS